jgi:hypothetical protein
MRIGSPLGTHVVDCKCRATGELHLESPPTGNILSEQAKRLHYREGFIRTGDKAFFDDGRRRVSVGPGPNETAWRCQAC